MQYHIFLEVSHLFSLSFGTFANKSLKFKFIPLRHFTRSMKTKSEINKLIFYLSGGDGVHKHSIWSSSEVRANTVLWPGLVTSCWPCFMTGC